MSRSRVKAPVTPATVALEGAGITYEARVFPQGGGERGYGAQAAAALGVDAQAVFKTLLVRLDEGRFVAACVPVPTEADLKAVAAAFGAKKAAMASPGDVQRLSGSVLGGVSPVGLRTPVPLVLDTSARQLSRVYVSGGRRGFEVALAPDDLVAVTGAIWARVGR